MFSVQQIKPCMKVIDSEERHVGVVDEVQEGSIRLKREGFADDFEHFVPFAAVTKIDDNCIVVKMGCATTVEAVAGAIRYARRGMHIVGSRGAIFGTSTVSGGSGIKY